ncbi:uncharacterized protein METZ01_LOCUS235887 [marine metagenome]|uniref:Uncharacterized protein n=1 Tax=marine metagenome TaxID=408172 RepID=A0A382H8E6_9ZZZZ
MKDLFLKNFLRSDSFLGLLSSLSEFEFWLNLKSIYAYGLW